MIVIFLAILFGLAALTTLFVWAVTLNNSWVNRCMKQKFADLNYEMISTININDSEFTQSQSSAFIGTYGTLPIRFGYKKIEYKSSENSSAYCLVKIKYILMFAVKVDFEWLI